MLTVSHVLGFASSNDDQALKDFLIKVRSFQNVIVGFVFQIIMFVYCVIAHMLIDQGTLSIHKPTLG